MTQRSVFTSFARQAFWLWMLAVLVLILAPANQARAQTESPVVFEFGVRGGIPLQNIMGSRWITTVTQSPVQNSDRSWITVGPTFGAMIHDRVQVEFGAMYRPVRFETETLACADSECISRVQGVTLHDSVRGHLWEFPLTANYHFGHRRVRPYVGGGIVLSQNFGGKSSVRLIDRATGNEIPLPVGLGVTGFPVGALIQREPSFVFNLGLRWETSRLNIQPEIRYTRHRPDTQQPNFGVVPAQGPGPGVSPRADQVYFTIGLSLRRK